MTGLAATVTRQTTTKLSPSISQRTLMDLKTYERLSVQAKALKAEMDSLKLGIEARIDAKDAGALDAGLSYVGGYRVTRVSGHTTSLSRAILMKLGVTPEMFEEATVTKPSTPYLKITLPGNGAREEATS